MGDDRSTASGWRSACGKFPPRPLRNHGQTTLATAEKSAFSLADLINRSRYWPKINILANEWDFREPFGEKARTLMVDAWSPHFRAEFAAVPFVSHQCAMPAKYCFGCHNTADVGQYPPTQDLTFNCQSPALDIIQQNPFLADLFS